MCAREKPTHSWTTPIRVSGTQNLTFNHRCCDQNNADRRAPQQLSHPFGLRVQVDSPESGDDHSGENQWPPIDDTDTECPERDHRVCL
jgi:hypothetical protein